MQIIFKPLLSKILTVTVFGPKCGAGNSICYGVRSIFLAAYIPRYHRQMKNFSYKLSFRVRTYFVVTQSNALLNEGKLEQRNFALRASQGVADRPVGDHTEGDPSDIAVCSLCVSGVCALTSTPFSNQSFTDRKRVLDWSCSSTEQLDSERG